MKSSANLSWIPFYEELASVLLQFRNNRPDLIGILSSIYQNTNMPLLKFTDPIICTDVDPFTVFASFNREGSPTARKAVMAELKEALGISSCMPADLYGIPVIGKRKSNFHHFVDNPTKGQNDIELLWSVFEAAIRYADNANEENEAGFGKAFNKANHIDPESFRLTIGLNWIRPNKFISLDNITRWYMDRAEFRRRYTINLRSSIGKVPSAKRYLELCDEILREAQNPSTPFSNLPELNYLAFLEYAKTSKLNFAEDDKDMKNEEIVSDPILSDVDVRPTHYWLYSPGPNANKWDDLVTSGQMAICWSELGDLSQYSDRESVRLALKGAHESKKARSSDSLATWQFVHDIQPGDVIFAKKGMHKIIGRGIVTGPYHYITDADDKFCNTRAVNWINKGMWEHPGQAAMKTLTDITNQTTYVAKLNALFEDELSDNELYDDVAEIEYPAYDEEDFLSDVYMDEADYNTLLSLIQHKKNVILQGAPGTGKTYCAKRLAYSIMGEKDTSRVRMIQFHQSYSYEDFIEGFRPTGQGFELKKGAFYDFCRAAADDRERPYFFIIDEINRGNLSKILGELFMLIEADKREVELRLLYSDELFSIPANVYVIGTMNTADRSIAIMDYALRRRFAFFDLKPGFDTRVFKYYQSNLKSPEFNKLIACVKQLNAAIAQDDALGEGFLIGHSFFCGLNERSVSWSSLDRIIEFELAPLLKEYWFDDNAKAQEWIHKLKESIK